MGDITLTNDEASSLKAQAEAEKALAEAEKAKADAKRAEAEARKLAAEAEEAEHTAWELGIHRRALESTDEFNHIYRFNGAVSEKTVKEAIRTLTIWSKQKPGCPIEIIFSSPGGDIIQGMALFDFIQILRERGHYITTGCAGMAASMAGILLQSGDHRWIGEQSWVLIHRASFGAFGSTYEVEDEVEFVKRIEERIINIFTSRSNLTSRKIKSNWDRKDWWIDADEAFDYELVDEVKGVLVGEYEVEASDDEEEFPVQAELENVTE